MSRLRKLSLASIAAAAAPSREDASRLRLPEAGTDARAGLTLKERAKQLSVYLEPPVYDQLREIAYTERTKIHPLMLEALDLLFRQRGARSIHELTQPDSR